MQSILAREQMIEQQVRAWDVLDARVLGMLRQVPRERFVPAGQRFMAYADAEVPLPLGQHMLRPSVVGLLQALEPAPGMRVLEVGTGSGFVAACLRASGARVRTLELFEELAGLAARNLSEFGMGDVEVVNADGLTAESGERYHAIAVTGSLPLYEPRFERQLEIGGRLFVVTGEAPVMEARLVRRMSETAWATDSLFETVIDPLVNAPRPARFRF
jgi:protein-L-isoaspartate(D-aspartate) O-methyltransferase